MLAAVERIASAAGTSVLLKGGHLKDSADDLLFVGGKASWFDSERIENPNTHGTGCTLSSAIAANLALGHGMEASIRQAKAYITGALRDGMDLGKGSGPLNHAYGIN